MFALCHFKDDENQFILMDKEDLKEITKHINIEIEKELSFEEFDKDYSFYTLLSVNDLLLRSLNKKARTTAHVLDELHISCWMAVKKEYNKIQEKKSKLSRSQRDLVCKYYDAVIALS